MLGVTALLAVLTHTQGAGVGTGFTYQGQLLENGTPANGLFDVQFGLYDSPSAGAPCADILTLEMIRVENGVFTATLDFGTNAFGGNGCWLEIGVRPSGVNGTHVVLVPRQPLTATPYSVYTLKAESLAGPLPVSQLPGSVARLDEDQVFTGTVTFGGNVIVGTPGGGAAMNVGGTVEAQSFTGDGGGLSNIVADALTAEMAERLWRIHIPFVAVTNAGNPPDINGKGRVDYTFRIGKHEVSNRQYAAFLNAVAVEDRHGLFDTNMAASVHGGILRTGQPGDYHYTIKPGMEHRPAVWVDFHDALRFCNWLHHGQPSGVQDASTTESGAYTMTPQGEQSNTIMRNAGARFWLPSDDEWYKAAYHQPWEQGGEVHGYWLFPIRSNVAPFSEPPPGDINAANVCCETERMATDVGAYIHSASYYGTYDQAGNVQEWDEEIIFVTNRRLRGGSWDYNEFYSESEDFEFDTTDYPANGIGFRVAGATKP